ncbi:MAG: fimbrial protein [Paraburkholderia sp.]|jgi:type 1 fimbria pilin
MSRSNLTMKLRAEDSQDESRVKPVFNYFFRWCQARLIVGLAVIIFAGFTVPAHAAITCSLPAMVTPNFGSISAPAGAAIGSTLATLPPFQTNISCQFNTTAPVVTSGTEQVVLDPYVGTLAQGFTDVYQITTIPWLGLRFTVNAPACNVKNVALTGNLTFSCPINGTVSGPSVPLDSAMTVTVSLVITKAVAAGTSSFNSGPMIYVDVNDVASSKQLLHNVSLYYSTGTVTRATCSVTQANVAVSLPTVNTKAFGGVGSVAASQPFALKFSCASGSKLSMVLTDNVNPSNVSNTLQLTAESTAKGVGIQVLNPSGSPISFGPDSAAPGGTNQWSIGNAPDGPLTVPLTARYISTGNVSAGSVKALATFTMSYQ